MLLAVKLKAGLLMSSWDLFLTPAVDAKRFVESTYVVLAVFSTDFSIFPSSQKVKPKSYIEFWDFLWRDW